MPRPSGSVRYENTGRVVVVTGGCSGIGRSICQAFRDSNATVACADIDVKAADQLPSEVDFFKCDVGDEENCKQLVDKVANRYGGLDVLVNNAAIQPLDSYRPIDQLDSQVYRQMLDINLSGYTFMAKYALRVMIAQTSGVIVNMASGQGHQTARNVPIYGPIKAANLLQTKQWGVQYARKGIRVVSISPGAIDTPLVRASLAEQGGAAQLANRHPIGRMGDPEEVARAAVWLASSDASFITGADLAVDGGLTAFGAFADPFPLDSVAARYRKQDE